MDTKALDRAYKSIAQIAQEEIKDKIKSGPTKAYRTGDLYRSVAVTTQPIQTGESIAISMNYYGEYVNDGTYAIQPPRRFIEAGLKSAEDRIAEIVAEAAAQDIEKEIDKQF